MSLHEGTQQADCASGIPSVWPIAVRIYIVEAASLMWLYLKQNKLIYEPHLL